MTKKHLLIPAILLISFMLNAQQTNEQKNGSKIGFSFSSFGQNDVHRSKTLLGAASYNSDHFYTLSFIYIWPINNYLAFETGFDYSRHSILIKPNLPPDYDNSPYKAKFFLLNIPFSLRMTFLSNFFINGGVILDVDTDTSSPIDNQTGVGALIGIGGKYELKSGASIFINPYLKFHSLIPFSPGDNHQKIYESGIRLGIIFNMKKKNKK